ncbi:MAG: hypothetical protein K2M34_02000 [Alphaproteobacteria bacterium]|nr:hypothetical protein [Alphaproteobacteria bacterium]
MARILQIRRGTTQENDNFTGMMGEVTFDTDTKTLRVHDGETLGGFKIARADQINTTGGTDIFDINDISDEFWEALFARIAPNTLKYIESNTMSIDNVPYLEYIFSKRSTALFAQPILVCTTNDAGYVTDDEVYSFGIGNHVVMNPNLYHDQYGLHIRLLIGSEQFWVANKTNGAQTNIQNNNWRIKFRLYY